MLDSHGRNVLIRTLFISDNLKVSFHERGIDDTGAPDDWLREPLVCARSCRARRRVRMRCLVLQDSLKPHCEYVTTRGARFVIPPYRVELRRGWDSRRLDFGFSPMIGHGHGRGTGSPYSPALQSAESLHWKWKNTGLSIVASGIAVTCAPLAFDHDARRSPPTAWRSRTPNGSPFPFFFLPWWKSPFTST